MMEREDYYFAVMKILPSSYQEVGFFVSIKDAMRLMLKMSADDPFNDYRVIGRQWSYRLGCYVGVVIS